MTLGLLGFLLTSATAHGDCLARYYENQRPTHYAPIAVSSRVTLEFPNQDTSTDENYARAIHLIEISQGSPSEMASDDLFQKTFRKVKRSYGDENKTALDSKVVAKIIQEGNRTGAFCKVGLSGVWAIRRYILKQLKLAGSEMETVPEHAVSNLNAAKTLDERPVKQPLKAPPGAAVATPGN